MYNTIATTTIDQFAAANTSILNGVVGTWLQLLTNTNLVISVIGFGILAFLVVWVKKHLF